MHDAFVGPTGCGKTALAMEKARAGKAAGFNVLVCDPFMSEWPCTWQTTDRVAFIAIAKRSRRCLLFIDEGGQTIKRDPDMEWLFTGARHWGHKTHALVQDGVQMTPTMRGQCSTVSLFSCDPKVAELWAVAFNEPGLRLAPLLPRYQFLHKTRWHPLRRCVASLPK